MTAGTDMIRGPYFKKKFVKPTFQQVAEYVEKRNKKICPKTFYDFYQANGWRIKNGSMKDWKSTVRAWEKNIDEDQPQQAQT